MDYKVLFIVIQFLAVLFSISVHESAHGWMADRCGDPTARFQGRITLNPLYHIDPIGTIIFPLLLAVFGFPVFGWAKPVPVNPNNLRHPRRDHIKVSAAGPVSNLLAAGCALGIFLLLNKMFIISSIPVLFFFIFFIDINIYLAIFNLIPIPPLDGSWILEGTLRGESLHFFRSIRPYGFIILLILINLRVLNYIADPIHYMVKKLIGIGGY